MGPAELRSWADAAARPGEREALLALAAKWEAERSLIARFTAAAASDDPADWHDAFDVLNELESLSGGMG